MREDLEYAVLHEFVAPAKRNLSRGTWDYLMGGSETETTYLRNRVALDSLAFRPRVLRDVEHVDTGGTLLGQKLQLPVVLAPIGSLQDIVAGGGEVPTRAAARFGAIHMLSSACAPGLEAVAACNDHPKIFQLYVRGDAAWVDDYLARAEASRYIALCFTVDLDHYGRRERDLAKRYLTTSRRSAPADQFQARFAWADLKRLRAKFRIPFILKGIATAEDARMAVEHGVEAIYVSNHGGRQLDHGKGAIAVLPEVVAAVAGRAEIIVDGGFMRGTDIVKAMALGANAVGLGRLQGIALAAGGEAGVVRMLELLRDEVTRCLGLLGVRSFAELKEGKFVEAVEPLGRLGLDSAFPLLKEQY
ncbi:MAG TPA: alpha-hydroxy acid oxidase [Hyphomicrobiaceae bacterium]|jgi:glycolate oxidase|nr:alpha-hydroxy acid oxidase [Hyphomicrobiaceae bacterium]